MLYINTKGKYRTGNALLINIGCSILAKKFNLKVAEYPANEFIKEFNLAFFQDGDSIPEIIEVDDYNIMDVINNEHLYTGINFTGWFQVKEFVLNYKKEIKNFFHDEPDKLNNTVFCHVRLDDTKSKNPGIDYYEKALTLANCVNGYISSDEPDNYMVKNLANKFNLEIFKESPEKTIIKSRECDNVVLSNGTFSWWIGFLNYTGRVFYPKIKNSWHGDIFVFPEWNEIDFVEHAV